jgi:RimJ/RimL family protein N-acetyltransferase
MDGRRVPGDSGILVLAFCMNGNDLTELMGRVICFDFNSRNKSAEFGYIVNPDCRGRGMGSKMVAEALDHLFATSDLNKLYCQTGAFNTPSVRMLKKLGFNRDGILREHHELDTVLWDDYIYSMLRSEWEKRLI